MTDHTSTPPPTDEQSSAPHPTDATGPPRDTETDSSTAQERDTDPTPRTAGQDKPRERRQITISIRTLLAAVVIAALTATAVIFIYRDDQSRDSLNQERADAADRAKAETVAGSYATGAATLDYNDLSPWIANVKRGVSPDLQKKYDVVGQAMEQIMVPLRMQMNSELVVAKTTKVVGTVYQVQAVVDTNIKSAQSPDGASSTAVYSLTMDKSKNWEIQTVGDPTRLITNNIGGGQPTGTTPAPPSAPPATPPTAAPAG